MLSQKSLQKLFGKQIKPHADQHQAKVLQIRLIREDLRPEEQRLVAALAHTLESSVPQVNVSYAGLLEAETARYRLPLKANELRRRPQALLV